MDWYPAWRSVSWTLGEFLDVLRFEKRLELFKLGIAPLGAQGLLSVAALAGAVLGRALELVHRVFGLAQEHDRDGQDHHHTDYTDNDDGAKRAEQRFDPGGELVHNFHDRLTPQTLMFVRTRMT